MFNHPSFSIKPTINHALHSNQSQPGHGLWQLTQIKASLGVDPKHNLEEAGTVVQLFNARDNLPLLVG